MSPARPFGASRAFGPVLLAIVVATALLVVAAVPAGPGPAGVVGTHGAARPSPMISRPVPSGTASSIELFGTPPSTATAGTPFALSWVAMNGSSDTRATAFSVACAVTVTTEGNGSNAPAWVNSTRVGALGRAANGSFAVSAAAWSDGVLNLSVTVALAVPVAVRLAGGLLPAVPSPVPVTVSADLDHLLLFDPVVAVPGARVNDTFWHVRDRFGDPAPGAFLVVEYSTDASRSSALVPVVWSTGGTTGAWVNYSATGPGNATVRVSDEANTTLLGPIAVPALVAAVAPPSASLPIGVEAAVALLGVAGVFGILGLLIRPRRRPGRPNVDGEEELRRLAEGRETVVELVRRAGSVDLAGIEAAWEPPPAPPAVADWVASLVTDGTLTASVGEGGRARFALAVRSSPAPRVTLDEEAMERDVARRSAETGGDTGNRAGDGPG